MGDTRIITTLGLVEPVVSGAKVAAMSSELINNVLLNNKQEYEMGPAFASAQNELKKENLELKLKVQTYEDELTVLKSLLKSIQNGEGGYNVLPAETFDLNISTLRGGLLEDARESLHRVSSELEQYKQENETLKYALKKVCESDLKRLADDLARCRILGEV